jgi:hypothetical protein
MVALFDLTQIRSGQPLDPGLEGSDAIYVDTSRPKPTIQNIIQALRGFAVFAHL